MTNNNEQDTIVFYKDPDQPDLPPRKLLDKPAPLSESQLGFLMFAGAIGSARSQIGKGVDVLETLPKATREQLLAKLAELNTGAK